MHLRHFIQLVGATALAGCTHPPSEKKDASPQFASLPKPHQEVYDALFRYMIAEWSRSSFKKWYLKLLDGDAPEDLLQRYRAEGLQVYPASAYRHGRGVWISIAQIVSLTSSHAELRGGSVVGYVGGVDGKYHLVKKQGRWTVESFKILTCA
ncbi:MAG: hypothetical protein K9N47_23535 [Prosthecobacter sp.]|uniref:hypothetical protein n=1 Tax=Prosthecobacter sp. TaxID=1965333 RepID=UPI002631121F|nr:hypothetical protein [Prosthecobacter sp.]MCF7789117.1 hypothetical protein [Prosthecobacter sp.]